MRFRTCPGFILLIILFSLSSCHFSKPDVDKELAGLQKTGDIIQNDFQNIIKETKNLVYFTESLYRFHYNYYPGKDTLKYELKPNGIFYNPTDDGGSAVFVSGHYPVTKNLKDIVYFTAPLDSFFIKDIKKNNPLITQAHFNERHSYLRIYPYIDVLNQFDPKQNIIAYNLYFLADNEHNPSKKAVMIDHPYVDPAGRGWIISSIAPVYNKHILEGVVGIDITIESMKKKYMSATSSDIMLLDSSGVVIMIDEQKAGIFEMPHIKSHKYLESIKSNEYIGDEYNLLSSKNKTIRDAFTELMRDKKTSTEVTIEDNKYFLISYMIPGLNWYIVKFIKEN